MERNLKSYSIVIPVYNAVDTLIKISEKIDNVFRNKIKNSYEIIFVDDASNNPYTWEKLEEVRRKNNNVKLIQLTRNFGQHAATLCGIKESTGNFIITMDDDLQHLPEDIPNLIEKQNHDIVIAQLSKKKHSFGKKIFSKMKGYFDYWIIGKPRNIQLSSFRLFSRDIAEGMLSIHTPYPFIPALMFYISSDVTGVEVTHATRQEGKTGYSLPRLIKLFSNLLITNSSFLLKTTGYVGFSLSVFSLSLGIYFIYKKIVMGIGIIGWTSIVVIILFIGGLLLFTIGILGEYLIRIIAGTERKPTYFIRKKEGFGGK